ncbi:MAG: tryptophan halogenase family protein [Pseudomonadota bacterium]
MKIKRIAIVGGGSAGWLAANHLGAALHADPEIEITLIESEEVPIIGVGEGTVPLIRESLQQFGISEADLIVDCDTTFKHGIKFVDWLNPRKHGQGNFYYHPFSPAFPDGYDITAFMLANRERLRFSDVGPGMPACEAMRCPKKVSSPPYQGEIGYAYHVNAHKFAQLLAKNAREHFGVRHMLATITGATRQEDGGVQGLVLKSGATIAFDFYVDCSGFASVLAGGVLKVPFVDKSHQLLTDTAMVQQVATAEQDPIAPYTKATAHAAGWIWDIPVTNRRGTGFVYSSAHMSEDAAVDSFAGYLGIKASAFAPRKIPMKIGYRKHFWAKNCVSLGLAQGFVEPLEATSIFLTDISAKLFATNFPRFTSDIDVVKDHCNEVVAYWWERTIDFIQLHYHISDRDDSAFWLDNANAAPLSVILKDRLARWQLASPKRTDFFSNFDLFDATSYSHILYGMQYNTRQALLTAEQADESRAQLDMVRQRAGQLLAELPGHREWLDKLNEAVRNMRR